MAGLGALSMGVDTTGNREAAASAICSVPGHHRPGLGVTMSHLYDRVVGAFATATTATDYHAAKKLAGRLARTQQFQVVDNAIACRKALMAKGVL